METQAPNKEQTIEIKPTSIHKSRGSSGDLFNEEFNSKQADLKTHHGIKKAKVSKLLTRKEREAEIDRGEKEFEAGKRRQKEKIAQDVQENLSYYRLVGECYVHGIMNGEAINLQKEQKLADQVFELR